MRSFLCLLLALFFIVAQTKKQEKPHVVMVVLDDLGVKDMSYSAKLSQNLYKNADYEPSEGCCDGQIPTPFIDSLADKGVKLARHYVHPTCTPTRASLMTGRYSSNTGLVMAMLHGSVAGLPLDMETLPQLLKKGGYRTHMSGKWHLGYSQWAQTPVGRGFESHTGNFLWDLDSWTKEIHGGIPWRPTCVDWSRSYENYSYTVFPETRHATEAITEAAKERIVEHADEHKQQDGSFSQPLFLYVAYTAAHSPLQPMERHQEACKHFEHDWRRDFCGMVVGLDEALKNLTTTIEQQLGENVVLMLTSDNGASPWFGGLSTPLRSGKTTPYEGGVRVPAFFVDFTKDHRYFGKPRVLEEMVHSSDWAATLVDIAGVTPKQKMDGVSLYKHLKSSDSSSWPRDSVVLDMSYGTEGESAFLTSDIASMIKGNMKLIVGDIRDPSYYYESTVNGLNTTADPEVTTYYENLIMSLEGFFGKGPFDSIRVLLTHSYCHGNFETKNNFLLYDLAADPEEKHNLAGDPKYKDLIKEMEEEMARFKAQRPVQRLYFHTIPMREWVETFVYGDCTSLPDGTLHGACRFTVPWLDDSVDTVALEQTYPTRMKGRQQLIEIGTDMVYHPISYWVLWLVLLSVGYCTWGLWLLLLSLCFSP